jgi:hypothetical protein
MKRKILVTPEKVFVSTLVMLEEKKMMKKKLLNNWKRGRN